ncbi:hypothetical protein [uncultured Fibrobacter sp.]|uniref:hypothetical protein n=1 Tax=uncultured Fibrobacter sp. TaxID=261512 RepID=UPI0013D256B6|nr:hypothetical protein [uncultured Fibrobacter sp.]
MDRPEIIANKGYETFGEHYFNAGINKKAREDAQAMLEEGLAIDTVVRISKLPEAEVLAIKASLEKKISQKQII